MILKRYGMKRSVFSLPYNLNKLRRTNINMFWIKFTLRFTIIFGILLYLSFMALDLNAIGVYTFGCLALCLPLGHFFIMYVMIVLPHDGVIKGHKTSQTHRFRHSIILKPIFYSSIILITNVFNFGALYYFYAKIEPLFKIDSIFEGLYLSLVTWTTLGYGDIVPVNTARLFTVIEALYGYIFAGIFIAIIIENASQRRKLYDKNYSDFVKDLLK